MASHCIPQIPRRPIGSRPIPCPKRLRRKLQCLCFVLGLGTLVVSLPGFCEKQAAPPELANLLKLPCKATIIPERYTTHNSGYTAMTVGHDGKVYVGTARYCDYGYWISYDPKTGKLEPVVDIHLLVAEDLYDINTQGKTHTKLFVGPDGTIYGGTKQGHELFLTRPEIGEESGGYPGGHLLSYNPKTKVSHDLGILRAQDGLMNGILDAKRQRMYFKTEPRTHFIVYEMDTHEVVDKGRVGTWGRYIDIDGKGNVWIPNHDVLTEYNVDRDELMDYKVRVEGAGDPYRKPYACVMGKDGTKLYGGDPSRIQEFDLSRAAHGILPMRYVCRAAPEPFERSYDIHTMIRDSKGRIYWSSVVETSGGTKPLLLMRYDPQREKEECLGYCVDPDHPGQKFDSIQGSAIDRKGTLYLYALYPLRILEFSELTRK